MKWIQFLLVLFLSPNLPLLQVDQAIGTDGLICEGAFAVKSEKDHHSVDPSLWFDLNLSSHFFNRVKSFLQLKSRLSILLSHFHGASPFWRPPPVL